jgi:alkylation response protein AidB-like acyl-CoA dehydrogenase
MTWPERTITETPESRALIEAARAMVPEIRERGDEIEAARRLPEDLVKRLKSAGFFRMSVPKSCGGLGVDPLTNFAVCEELARADASVGWVVMIGSGTAWGLSSDAGDDLLKKIFGDPDATVTGYSAISGIARVVEGGHRLTGRWSFGSGILHATYIVLDTLVTEDGESLRMRADGTHDFARMVIPASAFEIIDTWTTTGMRGTGSNDYTATDVFVPNEFTCHPLDDPRRPGPMYEYRPFYLLNMGAVPLGVGEAAIEAMRRGRGPFRADKLMVAIEPNHTLRNTWLAEGKVLVDSAREYAISTARKTWSVLADGGELSLEQRAAFRLAIGNCYRAGSQAVLKLYDAFGSSAIYSKNPVDRHMRDIQTMKQHGVVAYRVYERCGHALMGQDPKSHLF